MPTPLGGDDNIPTFVALLGNNELNLALLTDIDPGFAERLKSINATGLLKRNRIVSPSDFIDAPEADLDDLFDSKLYLDLVNPTYESELKRGLTLDDPPSHPRIAKPLEKYFQENGFPSFNHMCGPLREPPR